MQTNLADLKATRADMAWTMVEVTEHKVASGRMAPRAEEGVTMPMEVVGRDLHRTDMDLLRSVKLQM